MSLNKIPAKHFKSDRVTRLENDLVSGWCFAFHAKVDPRGAGTDPGGAIGVIAPP